MEFFTVKNTEHNYISFEERTWKNGRLQHKKENRIFCPLQLRDESINYNVIALLSAWSVYCISENPNFSNPFFNAAICKH